MAGNIWTKSWKSSVAESQLSQNHDGNVLTLGEGPEMHIAKTNQFFFCGHPRPKAVVPGKTDGSSWSLLAAFGNGNMDTCGQVNALKICQFDI